MVQLHARSTNTQLELVVVFQPGNAHKMNKSQSGTLQSILLFSNMKLIRSISVLVLFFGSLAVQATKYDIAVSAPYTEGFEECGSHESAQLHRHIEKALIASGYADKANSDNWMVYDKAKAEDITAVLAKDVRRLGERFLHLHVQPYWPEALVRLLPMPLRLRLRPCLQLCLHRGIG